MKFPRHPQRSVPVRYAHLHCALGVAGKETKTTTNRVSEVPNLFQDLTKGAERRRRRHAGEESPDLLSRLALLKLVGTRSTASLTLPKHEWDAVERVPTRVVGIMSA